MRKNWKAIANISNTQLRHNIIAATGDVAQGLSRGFPQYFLSDDESRPNLANFIQLVLEKKRRKDVVQACKDVGIPFERFSFRGWRRDDVKGVSFTSGGYSTDNGWGQYFWRSKSKRGETIDYEGATWLVLWNSFTKGDAASFDTHSLVVVPLKALADN